MTLKLTFLDLLVVSAAAVMLPSHAQSSQTPGQTNPKTVLENVCSDSKLNEDKFHDRLVQEVLTHADRRALLTDYVNEKAKPNRCQKAVKRVLDAALEGKDTEKLGPGRLPFVMVGIAAQMPEAMKLVESQMTVSSANEWLDVVLKQDYPTYRTIMKQWLTVTAGHVRRVQGYSKAPVVTYGSERLGEGAKEQEKIQLVSPLVISMYLVELGRRKETLGKNELADLNAIYAGTPAGHKLAFQGSLEKIVRFNSTQWIAQFREEPVTVQFRLLPLFSSVESSEAARELMWLSNHHADGKMRALASKTLDELLEK